VLQRIYDAELKSREADKFTAAELLTGVREAVWTMPADGERFTDAKPGLTSIRRNLQQQHVKYLLALVETETGLSPDLAAMARLAARELADDIGQVLDKAKAGDGSRLDFATRAHLQTCRSQIERVLNAPHLKVPGGQ
jgi:hypothetical protein